MLDLTTHSNGSPVRLLEISSRQNISLHYLEQLFRKLRNGRAVKSVRGPGGGYVLARSMDEITIKDVLDCVGENINPAKDILGSEAESADTVEFHLSKDYFTSLGVIMRDYLVTTTLGDLMRKSEETARNREAALKEAGVAAAAGEVGGETPISSPLRSPVGEIGQ